MRLLPLADERRALSHAEAVLLVRDDEAETGVFNVGAEERVGADDEVDAPCGKRRLYLAFLFRGHCTGQPRNAQSKGGEKRIERQKMLLREYLRRRHEGAGEAAFPHVPYERCGNERLAAADVTL